MKKIYAFLAAATVALSASADMYMIGNFNGWTLADPTALMTETASGVYTLNVEHLISGFKFNDGSWSGEYNLGGGEVTLGVPAELVNDGMSGNLGFPAGLFVDNAKVTLDINAMTVLVEGEQGKEAVKWYLAGTMNGWAPWDSDADLLEEVEKETVYQLEKTFDGSAIEFKVTTANWVESYGMGAESTPLAMGSFTTGVLENNSQTNIPCSLVGKWYMIWDYAQKILTASSTPYAGVEAIEADNNAEAVYYNLQGVRVNNPENGLYIVKRGNKVSKAYIF